MSVQELEERVRQLPARERRRFLAWVDENREELVEAANDLSEEQKAEVLRRRAEYERHPERFLRMNEQALDEMSDRIRRNVAARFPSARRG
jgi:hypothetical protein